MREENKRENVREETERAPKQLLGKIPAIVNVLFEEPRVLFAYLYGSTATQGEGNDIDIAVYALDHIDPYQLSADLKIVLYKKTGLAADAFDIRIINEIIKNGDLFGLLYLKAVLELNYLLIDKDPDTRANFLYRYGLRYRECEGLFQEVIT